MAISRTLAAAGLAAALIVLPACSDDGDDTTTDAGPDTSSVDTTPDSAAVEELTLDDVWVRAMPAASGMTAGYVQITSPVDDELLEVRVDASIAGVVELHETVAVEDDAGEPGEMSGSGDMDSSHDTTDDHGDSTDDHDDSTGMDGDDHGDMDDDHGHGAMTMRQVESIPVPAGETVVLEPGGLHIMFLEVPAQLEVGQQIELTFVFATAGEVTVTAEVRES